MRLSERPIWEPEQLQYISALKYHFATLHHIHLERCKMIKSAELQIILCSCPSLRSFVAHEISGLDIAEGQPWVCLGLEIFSAWIKFDGFDVNQGTSSVTQRAVNMQLSQLS
ncbi:hypothetical protein BGX24_008102 [Mortierella sp. AD032]|nr:hypothetical protein BGX24_008102 [Mortierella sp. AD032]